MEPGLASGSMVFTRLVSSRPGQSAGGIGHLRPDQQLLRLAGILDAALMSDEYSIATKRIVSLLGDVGARQFLKLLEQDDVVRADAFRQLHERGRSRALLDALTDLEAAPSCAVGWSSIFASSLVAEKGALTTHEVNRGRTEM